MFSQITALNNSPANGAGTAHLNDQANSRLLRIVKRQRANLDGNLPTYDSLIGYSLFLLLCEYDVRGETPRLKDIHLELGRSPGGVRRLVRALTADGWVEITRSERDLRTRFIVATPKLKRTIAAYIQSMNG
jgi:DNA-binding MarR family transcriptional regulator